MASAIDGPADVAEALSHALALSKRYSRLDEGKGLGAISKGTFRRVYAAAHSGDCRRQASGLAL